MFVSLFGHSPLRPNTKDLRQNRPQGKTLIQTQSSDSPELTTEMEIESCIQQSKHNPKNAYGKQPRAQWPEAFVIPSALSEHSLLGERAG